MRRPWMPPLVEGLALPGLFALAAFYDVLHLTPGPFMMALIGLIIGSTRLTEAAAGIIRERRAPAEQLPEVQMALQIVPLVKEFGPGVVRLALDEAEQTIRRKALPRGDR